MHVCVVIMFVCLFLQVHMDGKPYKCNECPESFALLGEFRIHITNVHADTKDLRCTECYKVFPATSDLSQHVRLEHRLECEVCMRTFSRLAYLQAHIEVHRGQSLFNCRFCTAGFDSEYAYKKHIKCHPKHPKGRRLHPCNVCDEVFANSDELLVHYRSDKHRDKLASMGLEHTSILHTIDGGELSPEIRSLVEEVTGSMGAAEVDERLMQSIRGDEGDVLGGTTTGGGDGGGGGGGGVATTAVATVTIDGVNESVGMYHPSCGGGGEQGVGGGEKEEYHQGVLTED